MADFSNAPSQRRGTIPVERISADLIADALPAMIAYWDRNLICRFANGAYSEWFGRSPDQMLGCHLAELLGDHLFALNQPYVSAALEGREQRFQRTLQKPDGTSGHTLASYLPRRDETGALTGFIAQVVDVTPVENARRALSLAALVFDSMIEAVVVATLDDRIVSVNAAFTIITGYEPAECVGRTTHFLGLDRGDDEFRSHVKSMVAQNGFWRGDVRSTRKTGEHFLAEQTTSIAADHDGKPAYYVSLFRDVTEDRRARDQLNRLASHDCLTMLPNRAALSERLRILTQSEAAPFSLLFIDLDGFKPINDRYGHEYGDHVLQVVARRLVAGLRENDFVARQAGDEFVAILARGNEQFRDMDIQARLKRTIAEPITLGANTISVQASIGVARHPEHGRTPAALLAKADVAMYKVKRRNATQRSAPADPRD